MTIPKKDALGHLGAVLYMLSDLHEGDRSRAFDEALEFHNSERPDARVEPSGIGHSRLVNLIPALDGTPSLQDIGGIGDAFSDLLAAGSRMREALLKAGVPSEDPALADWDAHLASYASLFAEFRR